ncbi:hypothetical protein MTO96_011526 [Rhipicephalus appendiculatus]
MSQTDEVQSPTVSALLPRGYWVSCTSRNLPFRLCTQSTSCSSPCHLARTTNRLAPRLDPDRRRSAPVVPLPTVSALLPHGCRCPAACRPHYSAQHRETCLSGAPQGLPPVPTVDDLYY